MIISGMEEGLQKSRRWVGYLAADLFSDLLLRIEN